MIDIRHLTGRLFKRIGLSNYIRPILFFENRIKKIGKYRFRRSKRNGYFYFYLDPSIKHPGLADRLKAIVSCYYISKQNGYKYKIVFDTPFSLKDYLMPNAVEWYSKENEIEFSILDTKIFDYTGELVYLKPNKYYICYNYSGV